MVTVTKFESGHSSGPRRADSASPASGGAAPGGPRLELLQVEEKPANQPAAAHAQSARSGVGSGTGPTGASRGSIHSRERAPAILTDHECVRLARWARRAVPGLMHLLKAAYLAGQGDPPPAQTAAFELLVRPRFGPREQDSPTLKELEREHLERVLTETRTVEEAAQKLGIAASTLWRKRKRYNLK
jgi:hypothetical protein